MPESTNQYTAATLYITTLPEFKSQFTNWQAKLNASIAGINGFISLEIVASTTQHASWVIAERFSSPESLSAWQASSQNVNLMKELKTFIVNDSFKENVEKEALQQSGVTEVIITQIHPDQEEAYRKWSAKIHQIEANFEGFRGLYFQSPVESRGCYWITLLQFDTPKHLDNWLQSKEREEILNESTSLISSLETHRMSSPYAGWFYSVAKGQEPPSVWKQTMLVLLVLFPIVMLELKYLLPQLSKLNISLATFISNALSVTLISFPLMPIAIYLLNWWLYPKCKKPLWVNALGISVVLFLYLLEILLFWY